jgi:ubiquinone/menaquinone biosynthesis C-methylase UbiE
VTNRDVARFGRWASTYDEDWLQPRFFEPVQEATLRRAALLAPDPRRLLDVGCGTGALLRKAADRFPTADLSGVDPAAGMVEAARKSWRGDRPARFVRAAAEALPFESGEFDLVTSTVSFHHWQDQQAGLHEIGRVLAPGGSVVLADMFAVSWLRVWFAVIDRRDRFHTLAEIERMLRSTGLTPGGFETVFIVFGLPLVSSVWARRGWRRETAVQDWLHKRRPFGLQPTHER